MLFYGGWGSRHTGMYELMNQCRFVYIFNFRNGGRIINFQCSVDELFPWLSKIDCELNNEITNNLNERVLRWMIFYNIFLQKCGFQNWNLRFIYLSGYYGDLQSCGLIREFLHRFRRVFGVRSRLKMGRKKRTKLSKTIFTN